MQTYETVKGHWRKYVIVKNKHTESLMAAPVDAFFFGGKLNRRTLCGIIGERIQIPMLTESGIGAQTYRRTNEKLKNGKTIFRIEKRGKSSLIPPTP